MTDKEQIIINGVDVICEYCEYQEYFDIIAKAKDGK